jgi:hypothetical protein
VNIIQRVHFDDALKAKPFLRVLVQRLLSLGGSVACVWNDDETTEKSFVNVLLMLGRVSGGKAARLQQMAGSQCHSNSINLTRRYPKRYQREIGFALSQDGLWRPHSWVWDIKKNQIVETTEKREVYFGFTRELGAQEQN